MIVIDLIRENVVSSVSDEISDENDRTAGDPLQRGVRPPSARLATHILRYAKDPLDWTSGERRS